MVWGYSLGCEVQGLGRFGLTVQHLKSRHSLVKQRFPITKKSTRPLGHASFRRITP